MSLLVTHLVGNDDILLTSPSVFIAQVIPFHDIQQFPVTFTYRMDGVAQERNESFQFNIEINPPFLGTMPDPIIRNMTGFIEDSDSKLVYFH